jgi:hypothetical protein
VLVEYGGDGIQAFAQLGEAFLNSMVSDSFISREEAPDDGF